jgi:hypothetical protein
LSIIDCDLVAYREEKDSTVESSERRAESPILGLSLEPRERQGLRSIDW